MSKWGRIFASMVRKTAEESAVKQRISTENTMKDLFIEHFAEIFKKIETPLSDTIDDFFFRYMQYDRTPMIEQARKGLHQKIQFYNNKIASMQEEIDRLKANAKKGSKLGKIISRWSP